MNQDYPSWNYAQTQSSRPSRHPLWLGLIASLVLSCGCLVGVIGVAGVNLVTWLNAPQLSYAEIVASAQATPGETHQPIALSTTSIPTAGYPSMTLPVWPSSTPTITPSPMTTTSEPTQRISPKAFIQQYYDLINKRQYAKTFSMLSNGFKQRNHCCKPDGSFDDEPYKQWWNSIKKVEVLELRVRKWDQDRAVVDVKLRYNRMDGNVIDDWTTFNLVADPSGNSWLFE